MGLKSPSPYVPETKQSVNGVSCHFLLSQIIEIYPLGFMGFYLSNVLHRVALNSKERARNVYLSFVAAGAFQEELQTLYGGVQTFVLFVGHARSGHSLIGAMLDAHPEIIIPHEFNLIAKWNYYKTQINSARLKNRIFFDLHSLSREQAMFGNRAPRSAGERHKYYCYHVHGQWQGKYRDKVKVTYELISDECLKRKYHQKLMSFSNPKYLGAGWLSQISMAVQWLEEMRVCLIEAESSGILSSATTVLK